MVRKILGEGPKNAKIMLVGEAPGKDEEVLGRPFVGRAGKFLDRVLKSVGIERKKCYITNVVKFRPTRIVGGKIRDRAPTLREIKKYLPSLEEEISEVKPRVVVLLGRTASALLGVESVSKNRGIIRRGRRTFLITYHPAAAMRNRVLKKDFMADLRMAAKMAAEK